MLSENLFLLQIIICLRMLKGLLNLQEEWDRGYVATLVLSFLSLLKTFVELQTVAELKYTFCPVECQRGRKIKLITTTGNCWSQMHKVAVIFCSLVNPSCLWYLYLWFDYNITSFVERIPSNDLILNPRNWGNGEPLPVSTCIYFNSKKLKL